MELLPEEAAALFGSDADRLSELTASFSDLEPAVNLYTAGGSFEAHEDGYSLTINCLLDAEGFEGGGTEFWSEGDTEGSSENERRPVVRVEPSEAGVGVLFNGRLRHQGRRVESGLRALYVASFDLD